MAINKVQREHADGSTEKARHPSCGVSFTHCQGKQDEIESVGDRGSQRGTSAYLEPERYLNRITRRPDLCQI